MSKFSEQFAGFGVIGSGGVFLRTERANVTEFPVFWESDTRPPSGAILAPSNAFVSGFSSSLFSVMLVLTGRRNAKVTAYTIQSVMVPMVYLYLFPRSYRDARNKFMQIDVAPVYRINRVISHGSVPRASVNGSLVIFVINNRNVTLSQRNFAHLSSIPQWRKYAV